VIKRDVALRYPMERDDLHEDYIMWLRVLKNCSDAVGINQPLPKYRLTGQGKSGSKLSSAKTTFKVYRYMGFGLLRSAWYFSCYALNGVKKYFFGGDKK
jgi:teichuronic acid biosynthesis glycosyltransferase TuaG